MGESFDRMRAAYVRYEVNYICMIDSNIGKEITKSQKLTENICKGLAFHSF